MATQILPQPLVADAVLVQRLAHRDPAALVELQRRHFASLYAQVYGILMDASLAESVVRNVFSQVWLGAGKFVTHTSTWSWLRDIAVELARAERALQDPEHLRGEV
jgi:DNA-directed RNA polymerase specialized sigma24 family protein